LRAPKRLQKQVLQKWLENKDYKEGKRISGKEIPRLQLWYQLENKYFKYRYDRWSSQKYDDILENIQLKVNNKTNKYNKYSNARNGIIHLNIMIFFIKNH
jgi:hypothetical protein